MCVCVGSVFGFPEILAVPLQGCGITSAIQVGIFPFVGPSKSPAEAAL